LKEDNRFIEKTRPTLWLHSANHSGYPDFKARKSSISNRVHEIAIAGGVSANSGLRSRLDELRHHNGWNVYIPPLPYTTDNAAMIAVTGVL